MKLFTFIPILLLVAVVAVSGCTTNDTTGNGDTTTNGDTKTNGDAMQEETFSVVVTQSPTEAIAGQAFTIGWKVNADAQKTITHTAIHYDTSSHPGTFGTDVPPPASGYPELTPEFASGTFSIPNTFTTDITVDQEVTIYFRAHAIIDGKHYWSDEMSFIVKAAGTTETVKEFTITAKNWDFSPSTITVDKGDKVKLTITSIDSGVGSGHGFFLSSFGINERLTKDNTVTVEFVADKVGSFTFFCNIFCGSGHSSMRGTLIVLDV